MPDEGALSALWAPGRCLSRFPCPRRTWRAATVAPMAEDRSCQDVPSLPPIIHCRVASPRPSGSAETSTTVHQVTYLTRHNYHSLYESAPHMVACYLPCSLQML